MWTARVGDKPVRFPIPTKFTKQNFVFLQSIIEAGKYRTVIDRRHPLDQVVEATRSVETKQKTGNVVLVMGDAPAHASGVSLGARGPGMQ